MVPGLLHLFQGLPCTTPVVVGEVHGVVHPQEVLAGLVSAEPEAVRKTVPKEQQVLQIEVAAAVVLEITRACMAEQVDLVWLLLPI